MGRKEISAEEIAHGVLRWGMGPEDIAVLAFDTSVAQWEQLRTELSDPLDVHLVQLADGPTMRVQVHQRSVLDSVSDLVEGVAAALKSPISAGECRIITFQAGPKVVIANITPVPRASPAALLS